MSVLLGAIGRALGWLLGNPSGISDTTVRDALISVWDTFRVLVSWLQNLFGKEMDAWQKATPEIQQGAAGFGESAYATAQAFDKLINYIMPASQRWLDGHIHQWVDLWIHDVYDNFVKQEGWHWRDQWNWDAAEVKWGDKFVDPNIADWQAFHGWFNTWPLFLLSLWREWWYHPDHFATWATPALAKPLVDWVNDPSHRTLRDELTQAVIVAAQDMPHIAEQVVVNILQSPGW